MPTVAELLAQTNTQLDALLAAKTDEPAEQPEQKLAASDMLAAVAEELKAGNVSKEREAYLRQKLDEVAKGSFEGTGGVWIPVIRVINDPMQIKPETVKAPTMQSLTTGSPVNHWASKSDLTLQQKAEIISKLIISPEVIQKGSYSDKLDELKTFFGISDSELREEYDLRWKVGDLISALQQAVKLEQFVAKSTKEESKTTPAEKAKPADGDLLWPSDMAGAKFDPEAKQFVKQASPWGDEQSRSRR